MPQIVAATWAELTGFFKALERELGRPTLPMTRLVEAVAASGYAAGLYGASSLDQLLISQYATLQRNAETLLVRFNTADELMHFSYRANETQATSWKAVTTPDQAFSKLEHFLRMQQWFVTYTVAN